MTPDPYLTAEWDRLDKRTVTFRGSSAQHRVSAVLPHRTVCGHIWRGINKTPAAAERPLCDRCFEGDE